MNARKYVLPGSDQEDSVLDGKPAFLENKSNLPNVGLNEANGHMRNGPVFKEPPIIPIISPAPKPTGPIVPVQTKFSHAGVTIDFIQRFADIVAGHDPSMTTARVVEEFIKPWTRKDSCSIAEQIFTHYQHVEHPHVKMTYSESVSSTATIYVCHAWNEVFLDFVGAVEGFHENESGGIKSDGSLFYWIDIFAINQWRAPATSPDWIPNTLPAGIEEIGHTCLVMSSCDSPLPLSRTWCLWEIYCSKKSNTNVSIQLTRSAQASFIKAFMNDYDATVKRFCEVDISHTDTTNPADRQKIFDAVKNTQSIFNTSSTNKSAIDDITTENNNEVNFHRANQAINSVFKEWIRHAVDEELSKTAVENIGSQSRSSSPVKVDHSGATDKGVNQSTVKLLLFAARLATDQGRYNDAEPLYKKALLNCEILLGDTHYDTLTCVNNLAVLLKSQGKDEESEKMYRRALAGQEKMHGLTHPDTLTCVNNLALLLQDMGKLREAEKLHRRALSGCETTCGHSHIDTLMSVNNLAALLQSTGKLAEAEEMYERAVTGFRAILGQDHPGTLTTLSNLAYLCRVQGQMEKAEKLYRQILIGSEAAFSPNHARLLAAVNNLALLLQDRRKFEEAEILCRRAVTGYALTLGATHTHTLTSVNNLANVLQSQGKLVEAENTYRIALEGYEETVGEDHINTITTLNNMAILMVDTDNLVEAETMCRRAVQGREKTLGPNHQDTLCSMHNLGIILKKRGKLEEAESVFKHAMTGRVRTLGANSSDTLTTVNALATLLKLRKKMVESEKLYRRALDGRQETLGSDHPATLQSVNNLALLLRSQDRLEEAEPLYRRVLEAAETTFGQFHLDTLTCLNNFAVLLKSLGKIDEAAIMYERAMEGREQLLGKDHPDTLTSVNNLAVIYKTQRKMTKAEALYRRALAGREKTLGPNHPSTLCSVNNLAITLQTKHLMMLANEGDLVDPDNTSTSPFGGARRGSPTIMDAVRRQSAELGNNLGSHMSSVVGTVNNLKGKVQSFADLAEVEKLFRRALDGRTQVLGAGHRDTADTAFSLGNLLEMKKDFAGAAEAYARAHSGYIVSIGPDHLETNNALMRKEACRAQASR